jgi:hypothetical protein
LIINNEVQRLNPRAGSAAKLQNLYSTMVLDSDLLGLRHGVDLSPEGCWVVVSPTKACAPTSGAAGIYSLSKNLIKAIGAPLPERTPRKEPAADPNELLEEYSLEANHLCRKDVRAPFAVKSRRVDNSIGRNVPATNPIVQSARVCGDGMNRVVSDHVLINQWSSNHIPRTSLRLRAFHIELVLLYVLGSRLDLPEHVVVIQGERYDALVAELQH